MKKTSTFLSIVLFITSIYSVSFGQEKIEKNPHFSVEVLTGYNAGFGTQANIKLTDFAEQFPFGLRLGAGYSVFNPGYSPDARRIFINNNTNGVPEKSGSAFDYRFDFLLPVSLFKIEHSYFVLGPRYSNFKGNFKYIGGNEDFDIISKQWGVGGGFESHFKMTRKVKLILAFGLDYFFNDTLTGHDTSYSPDNDNVNARKDNQNDNVRFVYKDADDAINQPEISPRAMIGLSFGF
ncbi:MAG: hypothetical protein ABFS16_14965 [Bacteroidota bacterium]